jgi:type VI secretion system secreted protein Hcp
MAETVELMLKANGTDIKGEPTQLGGTRAKDHIEVLYMEFSGSAKREAGSGMATGRRRYNPIIIRKRIDKATPLLAKAFVQNEKIEGVFRFFRPNPTGDGTTEHFYTIEIEDGRIDSVRHILPDCLDPASTGSPPLEEVAMTFANITWTFEDGGLSHHDSWGKDAML